MSKVPLRGGRIPACHPRGGGGPERRGLGVNLPGDEQRSRESGAARVPRAVSASPARPAQSSPAFGASASQGPQVPDCVLPARPRLGLSNDLTRRGVHCERKSERDTAQCGIAFTALSGVCPMAGSVPVCPSQPDVGGLWRGDKHMGGPWSKEEQERGSPGPPRAFPQVSHIKASHPFFSFK